MKVFMDSEFTGLHPGTTLISMGLVSDDDKIFYAELTDYDPLQVDDWIQENVIDNLTFKDMDSFIETVGSVTFMKGTTDEVADGLSQWLNNFKKVEIWSDCCHYDMVLFQGLFGGAFSVPDHVLYIPFDICTVMKMFGIDPDTSREAFIDEPVIGKKHNALYDARVIRACYDKLRRNKHKYSTML